jgi:enoyl-CoA hydratase
VTTVSGEPEIRFERRGGLVVVTLNRPRALNALSLAMCKALDAGLISWRADPEVQAALIKGTGERAFCAGGDIRNLYETLTAEGVEAAAAFYAIEYPMNARLHHFPKPYIALLDGITMGGGVGVSVHGSHRVVTERTVFAMPETTIGFFPDVGATYVLPRLPGRLGWHLGLTSARLGAADCRATGIGTHFIPSARLEALERALAEADLSNDAFAAVDQVLERFHSEPGKATLPTMRVLIDHCYGRPDLEEVLEALAAEPSGWGAAQLEQIRSKSPTSLAVTFRQLCIGATLDFDAAMRLEYRLVHRFLAGHDFREGIRALIVDKDNRPRWRPELLAEVSPGAVDAYFAPLPQGDLMLEIS